MGCRGIRVTGHAACLAHLDETDRSAYLATLTPGADLDHRGTRFSRGLLSELFVALAFVTSVGEEVVIGTARFDEATFTGARFDHVTFTGDCRFDGATFTNTAWFQKVRFTGDARFDGAIFTDTAWFHGATFTNVARFDRTTFTDKAWFHGARFVGDAWFGRATFTGGAEFECVTFTVSANFHAATFTGPAGFRSSAFAGDAWFKGVTFADEVQLCEVVVHGGAGFSRARFETAPQLGPLRCGGTVSLDGAVFGAPVTVEIAAPVLVLERARWQSTAVLRVRYADVHLTGAVLEYPLTLAADQAPFRRFWGDRQLSEEVLGDLGTRVRVMTLSGVDAAHLTLTDVDLSECRFAGAVHLDQLRLAGRTTFSRPPAGWHRRGPAPLRWSRRRSLVEEHYWRAATTGQQPATGAWEASPYHPDVARIPGPETVAAAYRQLRKSLEDGKDEPGAADFYYGEMEMRRHDRTGTTRSERGLLHSYWLLSGYGLRASRAVGWLVAAMLVTIVLLMGFGLPQDSPKQEAMGTMPPGGGAVTFQIDKADPQNPTGDRFTGKRFEKALNVTLNSVVFRSSGQDLTTTGTYIEMASRVSEPVLLGLAVLAVRNRVKR
ncbi:pentapeptide repeat-containing protein [Streptomyces collinus]|uniref:pentapeptide repeat-containing protein n=1 Tax=Streptomyces collinus TaxID=42684 RepID=UPI00378F849D